MCIDFTDLNVVYPKDLYLTSYIDCLIDGSSGYYTSSVMDAYSGYNQIQIEPLNVPKGSFMLNHDNYYYHVTPLGLKNVGATYQRLMMYSLIR